MRKPSSSSGGRVIRLKNASRPRIGSPLRGNRFAASPRNGTLRRKLSAAQALLIAGLIAVLAIGVFALTGWTAKHRGLARAQQRCQERGIPPHSASSQDE